MSDAAAAFGLAVGAALEHPVGAPLRERFTAPAVTVLIVDAATPQALLLAGLEVTMQALERLGVPRGRMSVLATGGGTLDIAAMRTALGVPVHLRDPARDPCFIAGRFADGTPLRIDDELREAESLVALGPVERAPLLLYPGCSDGDAFMRCAALTPDARAAWGREAVAQLGLDLGVFWAVDDRDGWRVRVGAGLSACDAIAERKP